jgi:hypothetical protein
MTRARRVDANQAEIVKALRAAGCSVAVTSSLGKGFPDLVVGYFGRNFLLEVKDGSKPPSKRVLTSEEMGFVAAWRGQYDVVEDVNQALRAVGL